MVEEEDPDPLVLEYWDRLASMVSSGKKRLSVSVTMIRQFFDPLLSSGSDSDQEEEEKQERELVEDNNVKEGSKKRKRKKENLESNGHQPNKEGSKERKRKKSDSEDEQLIMSDLYFNTAKEFLSKDYSTI